MKSRLGVLLFGIGVLFLAAAVGLAFFVAPAVTKLPYDLTACEPGGNQPKNREGCLKASVAEAKDATFLQIKENSEIRRGDLRSTTEVVPNVRLTADKLPKNLQGEAVVWDVYGTVQWTNEASTPVISQYSTELALDRVSAAAANWDGQWLQESDVPSKVTYEGQTYKFPFRTEKKDYKYFDRDLRRALPIRYKGTEKIKGVEAYRFEQVIPEEALNLGPDRISVLVNAFAKGATTGKVTYRNTRTVWVEPVSGNYVKVREQQHKEFVPDVGPTTVLLDADFVYTDDTITNSVKKAKETRTQLQLVGLYGPLGLGVLGIVALVVGLLFVIRNGGGGTSPRHASGKVDAAEAGTGSASSDATTLVDLPASPTEKTVPDQRRGAAGAEGPAK